MLTNSTAGLIRPVQRSALSPAAASALTVKSSACCVYPKILAEIQPFEERLQVLPAKDARNSQIQVHLPMADIRWLGFSESQCASGRSLSAIVSTSKGCVRPLAMMSMAPKWTHQISSQAIRTHSQSRT